MNRIRIPRSLLLAMLAALIAVNVAIPAKAVEVCLDCDWCWHSQGYWYACCPIASSGGYTSCEGDWDIGQGWHCDVGPQCIEQ
jgi:hypothetical protein